MLFATDFIPQSQQRETKVISKSGFSYEKPIFKVSMEYYIYERIITMCNFWHNFSEGFLTI